MIAITTNKSQYKATLQACGSLQYKCKSKLVLWRAPNSDEGKNLTLTNHQYPHFSHALTIVAIYSWGEFAQTWVGQQRVILMMSSTADRPPQRSPAAGAKAPESLAEAEARAWPQSAADARLFYRWCQQWTATLTHIRGVFDGDLDLYLIFVVFAQSEMARSLASMELASRGLNPQETGPKGMNALSLAEICFIPRETTRRKLKTLVDRDFLRMGPDGLYYLAQRYSFADMAEDLASLYRPPTSGPGATPR